MNSLDDVFYLTAGKMENIEYHIDKNRVYKYNDYTAVYFSFYDRLLEELYEFKLSFSLHQIVLENSTNYGLYTLNHQMYLIACVMIPILKEYFLTLPSFRVKFAVGSLDVEVSPGLNWNKDTEIMNKKFFFKKHILFGTEDAVFLLFSIVLLSSIFWFDYSFILDFSLTFSYFLKVASFLVVCLIIFLVYLFMAPDIKNRIMRFLEDYRYFLKQQKDTK